MANIAEQLFDKVLSEIDNKNNTYIEEKSIIKIDQEEKCNLETHKYIKNVNKAIDNIRGEINIFPPSYEDQILIEGNLRHKGFEALGFYKSRRYINERPFSGKWGIFIIRESLDYLSYIINEFYPTYKDARDIAYDFLIQHEIYHFYADINTLFLESVKQTQLYQPLRKSAGWNPVEFVEEALANRNAYIWSQQPKIGVEEFATEFMNNQPGAYSRFNDRYELLSSEWITNILESDMNPSEFKTILHPWVDGLPKVFKRKSICPTYIVRNAKNWFDPALKIPEIKQIIDSEKVVDKLNHNKPLLKRWTKTKEKLIECPIRKGLNFKPWDEKDKSWSVRVTDGERAHLIPLNTGIWQTIKVGPHTYMGHD